MAQTHIRDEYIASAITPAETIKTTLLNRISWGAVFAGLVMAFTTQVILNLLGIGMGFLAYEIPGQSMTSELSWGAALWWTISGVIAAGVGGLTAGRLAGEPKRSTAGWHGLISWAASVLLITMLMMGAAGSFAAGPFQIIMEGDRAVLSNGNVGASAVVSRDTMSIAAFSSAIALILGGMAAWFCGQAGATGAPGLGGFDDRRPEEGDRRRRGENFAP